ncbi:MAG TPA: hypothetical protein VKY73_05340 [Polyangiaceae bacterium]|nr:hypothetical protein [Polyangiaceae bacterium]
MSRDLVRAQVGAKSAPCATSGLHRLCRRIADEMIERAGGTPDELGVEAFVAAVAPDVAVHYVSADEGVVCAGAMTGIWLVPAWISPRRKRAALLYLAAVRELGARYAGGSARALYHEAMALAEALGGPGAESAETYLDQAEVLARTLRHVVDEVAFGAKMRQAEEHLARAIELGAHETMPEDVAVIEAVLASVPRSSEERQRIVDAVWRDAGQPLA